LAILVTFPDWKSELGMKRKIDIQNAPISAGSKYPEPFAAPCQDKFRRRLAIAGGLKQIGINLLEKDGTPY
jgi:uncharacterized cupin superfamily protein